MHPKPILQQHRVCGREGRGWAYFSNIEWVGERERREPTSQIKSEWVGEREGENLILQHRMCGVWERDNERDFNYERHSFSLSWALFETKTNFILRSPNATTFCYFWTMLYLVMLSLFFQVQSLERAEESTYVIKIVDDMIHSQEDLFMVSWILLFTASSIINER